MKFTTSSQEKRSNKTIPMLLLLVLLLCVVGFSVFATMNPHIFSQHTDISSTNEPDQLDENGVAADGSIENKTPDEIRSDLQKAQINVTDKLGSHILFPEGKAGTKGAWMVENLESNNVIMQCEVYLNDRLIAKSVPIKPKQHIETIELSDDVKAGEYDAIAYVNYFKLNTNEYISKAGFNIQLTIQ